MTVKEFLALSEDSGTKKIREATREFLGSNKYLPVNKYLIWTLGLDMAVLLAHLVSKDRYLERQTDNGWFYDTEKDRMLNAGLTVHRSNKCIKELERNKILMCRKKGKPQTLQLKINYNMLHGLLTDILKVSNSNFGKDECKFLGDECKNSHYYTYIKNNVLFKNNTNTNLAICGNDNLSSSKKTKQPSSCKLSPYLTYWNSDRFPHVRKHKKPNANVYKKVPTLIKQLRNGTFIQNNNLDVEWHKKKGNDLTKDISYTDREIYRGLFLLGKMHEPEYMPSWLEKKMNLCDLIYNPYSKKSWFLAVMSEALKKIADYHIKDKYPDITRVFTDLMNDKMTHADKGALNKGIASITKYYRELPKEVYDFGDFADLISDEVGFCKHYAKYILKQKWLKDVGVNLFNTKSKVFHKYLKDEWGEQTNSCGEGLVNFL